MHAKAPSRVHTEGALRATWELRERYREAANKASAAAAQRRGFERGYVDFVAEQVLCSNDFRSGNLWSKRATRWIEQIGARFEQRL